MKKAIIIASLLISPAYAQSTSTLEMTADEFFATEKGRVMLNAASSGKIDIRQTMHTTCMQSSKDVENAAQVCDCFNNELKAISDKALIFHSLQSYELYVMKTEAARQGDEEKLKQLKETKLPMSEQFETIGKQCEKQAAKS